MDEEFKEIAPINKIIPEIQKIEEAPPESFIINEAEIDQYIASEEFDGSAASKFNGLVPQYIATFQSRNIDEINRILIELINYLSFIDNSEAAELMIESGVFEALMQCNLIENVKAFYILCRRVVSCSKDVNLLALKSHLMHRILQSGDFFNVNYSSNICCIIDRIMQSSDIATALIYSTGLFDLFKDPNITDPIILRNISLLFSRLFKNSPIKSYKYRARKAQEHKYLNENELDRFFDNFGDDLFNREKIIEFHNFGIDATQYIDIFMRILYTDININHIYATTILTLNKIVFDEGIRSLNIFDEANLDRLFLLADRFKFLPIDSAIINLTASLTYRIVGKIDDILIDTALTYLFRYFKPQIIDDPPEYFDNMCISVYNLILCCENPKRFAKKFNSSFINTLKIYMQNLPYAMKKEVSRLFILIGCDVDYKIFDDDSMDIIVSFLDPENEEFEFAKFTMEKLHQVIDYQGKERFDRFGDKTVRELFVEANGDECVLELLNYEEIGEVANEFYDNCIDRDFISPEVDENQIYDDEP